MHTNSPFRTRIFIFNAFSWIYWTVTNPNEHHCKKMQYALINLDFDIFIIFTTRKRRRRKSHNNYNIEDLYRIQRWINKKSNDLHSRMPWWELTSPIKGKVFSTIYKLTFHEFEFIHFFVSLFYSDLYFYSFFPIFEYSNNHWNWAILTNYLILISFFIVHAMFIFSLLLEDSESNDRCLN